MLSGSCVHQLVICALLAAALSGCRDDEALSGGRRDVSSRTGHVGHAARIDQTDPLIKTSRPAIRIKRPGAVAVDAPERRARLSAANALDMCPGIAPLRSYPVLHTENAPGGYGLDGRYNTVSAHFRRLGASCLGGNEAACGAIGEYAMDWAHNSRLGGPKGSGNDSRFWNSTLTVNMRLLSPMLSALGIAEQFSPLAPADRDTLNQWLRRKVDDYEHGMRSAGSYKGGRDGTTARKAAHNHAVQSSIVAMSYGAWANDAEYLGAGIDQWFITLKSMRGNGSLPIETRRGARALFYHGRTLGGLVQLAERARAQGIDLYDAAPNRDKTIHRAVAFFVDAVEQPDLVLQYARTNKAPGPSRHYKVQDLGNVGSTMGWIAPYISRFPNHPNSLRLLARREPGHPEPRSYLTGALDYAVRAQGFSSEWIGVDARCLYMDPRLR